MKSLSLLEEFLLLTLEDEGGEFDQVPEIFVHCGIAGATLMELALQGRIDSDLHGLWVVDPTPTGDDILDKALNAIAAEPERRSSKAWIKRLSADSQNARDQAIQRLCERGILRQHDAQYLWVMKDRRYPMADGQQVPEAKGRILALIYNNEVPDARDIALTSLASACSVFRWILQPKQFNQAKARIDLLSRMDLIGGEIARAAQEVRAEVRAAERTTILAGFAGNVVEWYDFAVYGFFATIIGAQFFPTDDASTSLMASLGVFAVGFLGRPMGALLLGHLGDSKSRHSAMMLSVGMMVVPTLLMALLPTYAQIGIAAPALLVLLRFVQGMAVGGEYTTSVVVMVEAAQPRRQGYVGSWGKIGIKVGVMLGSSLAAGLFAILSPEQMASWGWRAAFLFGLVLGILVFALRSRMPENKVITSVVEKRTSPLLQAFRSEWKAMLKIIAILMPGSIAYNLAFVYLPIWLKANHNIPDSTLLTINTMAIGVSLLLTPLSGTLADRFGCRTMMLVGIAGMGVLSLPLFWLMIQPSVLVILIAQCTFAAILSLLSGGMAAFMVQAFPKHLRCSGLSVGYNVAVSVFGGSLPLVATFMIERSGYALSPAIYVSLISIVAFMVMVASVRGLQRYATA